MLEQFGIHSKTTGAHAGWQHAFAETHGALMGEVWHARIMVFHGLRPERHLPGVLGR